MEYDQRKLTFSQRQGLEPLPGPLALEELSFEVRNRLWALFFGTTDRNTRLGLVEGPWNHVLYDCHIELLGCPVDEYSSDVDDVRSTYKDVFLSPRVTYNKVFDLLEFLMRHYRCPPDFIANVMKIFSECRLAYIIDMNGPAMIIPAVTPQEGEAIQQCLADLAESGMDGALKHLRNAGQHVNNGQWGASVRESIHAVESVAKIVIEDERATLSDGLKKLKGRHWGVHPAFAKALSALYGWTSDEAGVRHAATAKMENVDKAEAVFMLGACASFCTYLLEKKRGQGGRVRARKWSYAMKRPACAMGWRWWQFASTRSVWTTP